MSPQHAHPLTILTHLWRVFYLTIIPVIRGFMGAVRGDFSAWLRGAWIDIGILLIMVAGAVWSWRRVTYTLEDEGIRIASGLLRRHDTRIPWDKIVTLSVAHPFFLRPLRGAYLRADTLGGSFKDADFTILLTPRQAAQVWERLEERDASVSGKVYTPSTSSIVALALLTSNAFAGVVFIATLVSQSGKLLGQEFSERILGTMETLTRQLAFGIPYSAAMLAYLLLFGWLYAFVQSFLNYKNMRVFRRRHTLLIRGGLLTRREYCIDAGDINFLDIRQSVSTKLLHLYSLYISAVGYGKQKDDISCVIPTAKGEVFNTHHHQLFPGFDASPRQLTPKKTIFRFIGQPLAWCLGSPAATALLCWLFPGWRSFILFLGLMLLAPGLVLMVVRLLDYRTSGVSCDGISYTLRYSKGFYIHTVIVPKGKVVLVQLRQSPFQRRNGSCDLLVYTQAEGRSVHTCRGLPLHELQDFFHINNQ